jgi:hypothetical protein
LGSLLTPPSTRNTSENSKKATPQEWIDMLRDLEEIWTQNSMTGGTDRASTVRALVRGESAVAFETALQDARTAEGGEISANQCGNHVQQALKAVTETVFPHRALETQQALDEQEDV